MSLTLSLTITTQQFVMTETVTLCMEEGRVSSFLHALCETEIEKESENVKIFQTFKNSSSIFVTLLILVLLEILP